MPEHLKAREMPNKVIEIRAGIYIITCSSNFLVCAKKEEING